MSGLVLAIDGPSGSGKSSTAKAISPSQWTNIFTDELFGLVFLKLTYTGQVREK